MSRPYATCRPFLLCLLAVVLAVAVPASAQVPGDPAHVEPAKAGKPSHAFLDLRLSEDPQSNGENLTSFVVAAQRGTKLDPKAVAELCSDARATAVDCPGKSKVGSGKVYITASNAFTTVPLTVDLELFLAAPKQSGDLRSVVVQFKEPQSGQQGILRGRLVPLASGPFGYELRFDDMSAASKPPEGSNVTIRVERLTSEVGAFRYERKKAYKTVKKNGVKKRVKYYRKIPHNLITNPKTCDGAWEYQIRIGYPGGRESVRDASTPCTG
ncbi:MAG TPA: hypothetical protein VF520_04555 [Thermoleophilaceae bacterium]